jgi:Na+/proline symporter
MPVLLGMIARVRFPSLASPDLALPMLLLEGVPPAVGTLGLAAGLSAEISTADAGRFILTTSVSRDLFGRFLTPGADDRRQLALARYTAVALGAVAVVLAMAAESVISALSIFYTLMGVGLFVPMLAGLFVPRARTAAALASSVAGVLVVVAVQTLGHPGPSWMTPAVWGLLAALAAMLAALAITPSRPPAAN